MLEAAAVCFFQTRVFAAIENEYHKQGTVGELNI